MNELGTMLCFVYCIIRSLSTVAGSWNFILLCKPIFPTCIIWSAHSHFLLVMAIAFRRFVWWIGGKSVEASDVSSVKTQKAGPSNCRFGVAKYRIDLIYIRHESEKNVNIDNCTDKSQITSSSEFSRSLQNQYKIELSGERFHRY